MASEPLYRKMDIRDRSGRVVGSKQTKSKKVRRVPIAPWFARELR